MHSLRGVPHVIDMRNLGLMAHRAGAAAGQAGGAGLRRMVAAFEKGMMVRTRGDTLAMSPPFIVQAERDRHIVDTLRRVSLRELA